MKKLLFITALLTSSYSLTASAGSCTFSAEAICVQYDGDAYAGAETEIQNACTEETGTYSSDKCADEGKVSFCHLAEGSPLYYKVVFYAPTEADVARSSCSLMGGRSE